MYLLNWNNTIIPVMLLITFALPGQSPIHWDHDLANLPENFQLEISAVDHKDRIWLGNQEGLWLFDGSKCRHYVDLQLPSRPTSLHVKSLDSIAIGTQSGQFYLLIDKKVQEIKLEEGYPESSISRVQLMSSGRLWFSTTGEGIYYYNGQRLYNVNESDGLVSSDISDFIIDNDEYVWLATESGISKLKYVPDSILQIENFGNTEGLLDPLVTSLAYDPGSDHLIAGTHQGGLFRYEKGAFRSIPVTTNFNFVQKIYFVNNTELLVYGKSPQLSLVDISSNKIVKQFSEQGKSVTPAVFSLEGFVWLFPEDRTIQQMSIYFTKYEAPETPQAILCLGDSIWIGTKSGLYFAHLNGTSFNWVKDSSLVNENIISLAYNNNALLVGTFGNGLFRYVPKTEQVDQYSSKDGLPDESILDIYNDGKFIWLGTLGGLAKTSWHNGSIQSIHNLVDTVYVYHMESMNGKLHFSTHGHGAGTINGEVQWFEDTVLSTGEISTFALLPPDQGMFVTTRNGLIYRKGKESYNISTPSNISLENTSAIAADSISKRFFISHTNGLDVFSPGDSTIIHLGDNLKLNFSTTALNAYCFNASKNEHLFGSADGFYSVSSHLYQHRKHPEVEVLHIWVNNELKKLSDLMDLKSDEHTLQLELLPKWYTDPKSVHYRYKFKGFHHDWITTSDQKIVFPEIPYGRHELIIQAGIYGDFNQDNQLSIPLYIAYPIWMQTWFIILVILLTVSAIYGFIKNREAKLQRWAKLEKEKANAQIQALKSQVSPHFMFNSFNTLIALIEESPDKAVVYAEQLSDFFRNLLGKRNQELLTLREEVDMAIHYISLLKTRYGNSLKVNINIDNWEGYILTYTLQILTENVIKHNVISRSNPLYFSISRSNGFLIIKNDLQPKYNGKNSMGFGLESIRERYMITFKKEIDIEQTNDHFTVRIPIIKKHEI